MTESPDAIRKTVFITAKQGCEDALRQAMLRLQAQTRLEPGCTTFTFYAALDAPGAFVLVEDFVDAQAFEGHLQLPHTRDFFAAKLVAESRAFG